MADPHESEPEPEPGSRMNLDLLKGALGGFKRNQQEKLIESVIWESVVRIFRNHDVADVRDRIENDRSLIEDAPPEAVRALREFGPSHQRLIHESIRPRNIIYHLRNPGDRVDDPEVERTLSDVAELLEEEGGEWLEDQCIDIYRLAGIV